MQKGTNALHRLGTRSFWRAILIVLMCSGTQIAAAAPPNVSTYTWHQDQDTPTVMMEVDKGFCVLQEVSGSFRGRGEEIWIRKGQTHWLLGGKSSQQGVFARAQCMPARAVAAKGAYLTSAFSTLAFKGDKCGFLEACAGDWPTVTTPLTSAGNFCYLAEISGRFNGNAERVEVRRDGNDLFLEAATQAPNSEVFGAARCFGIKDRASRMTTTFVWGQGAQPVKLPNADEAFCALTKVQGGFFGEGEAVSIWEFHNEQWLGGRSAKHGVQAWAMCYYYTQG